MNSLLYELMQNFILGGLITVSISYLGTFLDPLTGAIWWSFPLSLLPTIYFMKKMGKQNKYISSFVISTCYSLILLFISCWFMSYFLKNSDSIAFPIFKAIVIWLVSSIIFYNVIKYYKLEDKFI
tara:strand:- start:7199 stop:7573 length:375 start_codon:yes stop_codon:yes gene_type:complete